MRTVIFVFVGLAVLIAMVGCATTTPLGDDSNDDTDPIETDTPETESEPDTPKPDGDATSNAATEADTPQNESTPRETVDDDADPADETSNTPTDGADESGSDSSTGESTTTGPIDDTGLPVDENRIYNQTRDLLGSDADAPSITVRELNHRSGRTDQPFFDYMGLTNESEGSSSGVAAVAVATGPDSVVVNEEMTDQYGEERVGILLAHEFAHTIQFAEGWIGAEFASKLDLQQTESLMLYRSLIEGGAVFTADKYADHVGVNRSEINQFDRWYRTAPAELVYAYAPYHHGGQYFDAVLDSGRELDSAYTDSVPDSTEEVLHPEYDDTEPTQVTFSTDSNRDGWIGQSVLDDKFGAMFVDVVLTAHVGEDTASEASKGWGNDQLFEFETTVGRRSLG